MIRLCKTWTLLPPLPQKKRKKGGRKENKPRKKGKGHKKEGKERKKR